MACPPRAGGMIDARLVRAAIKLLELRPGSNAPVSIRSRYFLCGWTPYLDDLLSESFPTDSQSSVKRQKVSFSQ